MYEVDGAIKTRSTTPKFPLGSVPENKRIIKAKKIRGVFSMGMIMPNEFELNLGSSIVEQYGLKKWEEQEEENIVPNRVKSGFQDKKPTEFSLPYYDIEGFRKYAYLLKPEQEIVICEKIHGSNAAYCYYGDKLWVKSRQYYKEESDIDSWWLAAKLLNLPEKLSKYPKLAFFGELVGYNKGFKYGCKIKDGQMLSNVIFFDIYDTDTKRFLNYDRFIEIINDLGLEHSPILYRGKGISKEDIYKLAEGKSTIDSSHIREGVVIRSVEETFSSELQSRFQLKLIGEGYSLQK